VNKSKKRECSIRRCLPSRRIKGRNAEPGGNQFTNTPALMAGKGAKFPKYHRGDSLKKEFQGSGGQCTFPPEKEGVKPHRRIDAEGQRIKQR